MPLISVVLPFYNTQDCLKKSVESILNQSFVDFELLLVNDGSQDQSSEIASRFAGRDTRVRIIQSMHQGLSGALNKGIAEARGEYIARQDADDISLPDRFARQIEILEKDSECVLVGSGFEVMCQDGITKKIIPDEKSLAEVMPKRNMLAHSSVMFRKSVFDELGGYDITFDTSQDYDLWLRMLKIGSIRVVPEVLLKVYRKTNNAKVYRQYKNTLRARLAYHNPGFLRKTAIQIESLLNYLPDLIKAKLR